MDKPIRSFAVSLLIVLTCVPFSSLKAADNKTTAPTQKIQAFDQQLSWIEGAFVSAAEAMPDDKYSFIPERGEFKGVRNFGQLIKHAAGNNYMLFAAIQHQDKAAANPGPGGDGPPDMTSKAAIVKYIKDSFGEGHQAFKTIYTQNCFENYKSPLGPNGSNLGMALAAMNHTWDIYGQVVEYLRMNNIVPPASRPDNK